MEVEGLEERSLLSATFYTADGTGNNVANPTLGTAGTDLLRVSPVAYADGISAPSLPNNPSARVISDILNNQADPSEPVARTSTPSIRTACPTSATPGGSSSTTTWT